MKVFIVVKVVDLGDEVIAVYSDKHKAEIESTRLYKEECDEYLELGWMIPKDCFRILEEEVIN
jgi:hypothetical protein